MRRLTVASQQMRTSYRRLGLIPSSKNQDSVPLVDVLPGKLALIKVRTLGNVSERGMSSRLSILASTGLGCASGVTKMTFSTFARTLRVQTKKQSRIV